VPNVALVFPYVRTRAPTEMLFPPLGVATLAAQLLAAGIESRIFDCTFGSLDRLGDDLAACEPDIVGVSSMATLTHNTMRVAALVRKRLPHSLLVAGGPLPTVFPRRYADLFDVVFRGEADLSFPRFCRDYLEGRASSASLGDLPLHAYDGLFVSNHGLPVDNPTVHHDEAELRSFPSPDRSQFDHAAYQEVWLSKTGCKVTSIITTLGCPFGCDFCSRPVFGSVVRRRPLDGVFAEIEQLRELGYDSLWIADDTFTLSRTYLEEFCARMAGGEMTWSCLSRADGIDEATVRMMKEAGCRRVYLGLESGSQSTLTLMNKKITVEEGVEAVRRYREGGIEVAGFFIVGYPGETLSSIEATFRLALELPLHEISFNVPYPLPGSALFDRLGGRDEGRDWEHENEVTFFYPSQVDQAWLRGRIDETVREFARKTRR
jgi:anaerobic magnesium-protoporphyrin IX monomethyl ester cyclase